VGLHLIHRTSGYLLVGLLLFAALSARQPHRLGRALGAAFLLALAQVVVGIANVLLGLPVEVTGLHSALAAALVLTLAFALDEAWRRAPATIH
jgi:heme A synthase